MMEKQNRTIEKTAAGDARDIDDLVDGAARRFAKKETPGLKGRASGLGLTDPVGKEG